ncbi:MAG: M20/M25/M40 family metallo-hydrolase, partial [Kofleriaceae bacterium]
MPGADSTQWVEDLYTKSIVPTLVEYIKIPNKSAMFDPEWKQHGHMDKAVALLHGWAKEHLPEGAKSEVVQLGDRTPVIFIDIPGTGGRSGDTVMLYGHLDKQPEMTGWREGLGPWIPVLEGDKLYGRGGADDGYAIFASLTAINVLRRDKIPHARCVVLIEACEESGSYDLPAYIDHLAPRIGDLSLVVCLDSGCANY